MQTSTAAVSPLGFVNQQPIISGNTAFSIKLFAMIAFASKNDDLLGFPLYAQFLESTQQKIHLNFTDTQLTLYLVIVCVGSVKCQNTIIVLEKK